jgi:hypothetical protein
MYKVIAKQERFDVLSNYTEKMFQVLISSGDPVRACWVQISERDYGLLSLGDQVTHGGTRLFWKLAAIPVIAEIEFKHPAFERSNSAISD